MEYEERAINIINNRVWYIIGSDRRLSKFYQGMKGVHKIRKLKGIPEFNYEVYTDPGQYYLKPVYTAVSPQLEPGQTDCQRGLEGMIYYDDIESMKVEMDAIQLNATNSQPTYTVPALDKFQKILSVVNDRQNENGEIRLILSKNYDQHGARCPRMNRHYTSSQKDSQLIYLPKQENC